MSGRFAFLPFFVARADPREFFDPFVDPGDYWYDTWRRITNNKRKSMDKSGNIMRFLCFVCCVCCVGDARGVRCVVVRCCSLLLRSAVVVVSG